MGNLRSVEKAFARVGHDAVVTSDPKVIADASHVVLPGVGAFPACMSNLESRGLAEPVLRAIEAGKPFLGLCVGMQILFSEGEEFGRHPGLGVLPGRVVRFPESVGEGGLKVPHMGWNTLKFRRTPPAMRNVGDGSYVYFVHSYIVLPDDPGVVAATTEHGVEFVSAVWKDNVVATQFHPEKSQGVGLSVIEEFGRTA
ncbi:MAG: imidazole glycerol phosphate synthase, glutamine amidotransferase subunit [Nitrospirae bacterium RBG_16_64_22]|nr:MAG: imidazole glycerol phosphate synthase, glutamine amidotransferase subunit [Nitrospirae bacterium RBG_16_64_22]